MRFSWKDIVLGHGKATDASQVKPEPTRRILIELQRGEDGLFVEPDYRTWDNDKKAEYEKEEEERRRMFAMVYDFGDRAHNPETFSKTGDYPCIDCNKQDDSKVESGCALLPIIVDKLCGSCRKWERKEGRAFDPEVYTALNPDAATVDLMSYGVSLQAREALDRIAEDPTVGKVFGCHNCPFAVKALEPDSAGREHVCRQGLFRIFGQECCAINGDETVDEEPQLIPGYKQ